MALGIYNGAGDLNPVLTFGGTTPLVPGTPSAVQQFDVHNNRGGTGADTLSDIKIIVFALVNVSPGVDRYQASGHDAVDQRWVEVRRVAGINRSMTVTDWTPLGASAWLEVPNLGNDEGAEHEVRVNPPPTADVADVSLQFVVGSSRAESVGRGHSEASGDGVLTRGGDETVSEIIECSGNIAQNPGGADDKVQIPDLVWEHVGARYSLLTHLATLDGNDGASSALAAGQEYWCTLSAGAGTITQTKSVKGVALSVTAQLPPPAGEILLGYVLRQFGAVINDADITNAWIVGRFGFSSSGLVATIGPGHALVDNRLVARTGDGGEPVSLTASSTNRIWLIPTGGLQATVTAARPTPRAYLLWVAVTDGSAVTASTDFRSYIGRCRQDVVLTVDSLFRAAPGLAVNDVSAPVYFGGNRDGLLMFPRPVALALDSSGTGTGGTRVDIQYSEGGGAWTSLFTSSGTDDRRPYAASAAGTPVSTAAVPEVIVIKAGWRLRAKMIEVPGTTVPAQAVITLAIEVP